MGHCLWGSTQVGRCLLPGWGLSGNTFKLTWLPVNVIWGKSISLLSEISLRHKLWIWTLPFLFLALGNWPGNFTNLPRSLFTVFAIDTIWSQRKGTAGIIKSWHIREYEGPDEDSGDELLHHSEAWTFDRPLGNFRLPWWLRRWRVRLQCGRSGFDPWVGKIPLEKGMVTHSSIPETSLTV